MTDGARLTDLVQGVPDWALSEDRSTLVRSFAFDTFPRAFGFVAEECDGHDTVALERVLRFVMTDCREQKPRAVIARTVKGKGVSFMEGNNAWHYLRLDAAAVTRALHELEVDDA